ncbi:MAG TPA: hypothetical protein PK331_00670 [Gordonia sp. (in: high G+C Gram-positive bacteria)]|uniref:hypothetical protein n=1 Tax=unclassified Gordonia (in: high G+C Gram-positive bacteria) TaxID=2657482 RepID=UPI000FC01D38|nr:MULTISPECIES: hypothetical protein [unclassified Gordonia (in: high G+C Gram-positive bacteria)]RTL03839.1 MAG: hypothetical protein EKK62_17515 [Acidimicrobiia bacterium]HNP55687.1 hypothetical protein [Gordonia sp. (in: high G+C Gram-positive bacteria)]HRC49423.1 hypothetical protein [Gordonia sp. (in: high G+C Gram-positive bacteria)]
MKRRLSIAFVTTAAGLTLGTLAVAPALAATPQKPADAQTTGFYFCIRGPSIGSLSTGWCI